MGCGEASMCRSSRPIDTVTSAPEASAAASGTCIFRCGCRASRTAFSICEFACVCSVIAVLQPDCLPAANSMRWNTAALSLAAKEHTVTSYALDCCLVNRPGSPAGAEWLGQYRL